MDDSKHVAVSEVADRDKQKENLAPSEYASKQLPDKLHLPKQLVRRIDLRILPTITIIYVTAFLDRINFGNALVYGLRNDLKLQGQQANICISAFFIAYVVFEIPATMLMKRFKPHIILSICMFAFGLLTLLQGFAKSFGGLLAARFFMGMAEAAIYPGCFYLLSMWYRRDQAQKRFTFFFSGASFAGAFGGLLATGIGKMNHMAGYAAWQWIFIIEGALTCALALISWFTITDFPEDTKWLSTEERHLITQVLAEDQGLSGIDERVTWRSIVNVLKDVDMLLSAPLYSCLLFSAYGLAFFIPSIIMDFGLSPIRSQLYTVAPWSCSLVLALILAYFSDLTQRRFYYILGCLCIALVGSLMLFNIHDNVHAGYAGVFLYLMGTVSACPLTICWYAMNFRGHQQRAIAIPWQIGLGNVAGIASTFAFPPQDAPRYTLAYSVGVGLLCLGMVIATSYFVRCRRANQKLGYRRYIL